MHHRDGSDDEPVAAPGTVRDPAPDQGTPPAHALVSRTDEAPRTTIDNTAAPRTTHAAASAPRTTHDAASAPRTTLDAASAPYPTLDAASAPRTTLDAAAPPLRTLDAAAAPHTTLDSAAAPRTTLDAASTPYPTLDNAAAPRTTVDSGGAPRTSLDGHVPSAPRTSLDGHVPSAPRTSLDGHVPSAPWAAAGGASGPASGPAGPRSSRHRVNLPAALEDQLTTERVLASGGEADLLLARRHAEGDLVVVRRHRDMRTALEPAVLDQLSTADTAHFVRLLDWGKDDDAAWEIIEYAEYGSLADLVATQPAPWPGGRVRDVVAQIGAALRYAHSLELVHRDIKPANVLVRSLSPLDLVLTDFGLTRVVAGTEMMAKTNSRTSAYAAPEAAAGAISRSLDWWALGMIVVELLTGRHPYRRPDGSWLDDMQILKQLTTSEVPLDEVTDPRWRLLCEGLLTRQPRLRWGSEEVARWLAGHRPDVAPRGATKRSLVFRNVAITEPAQAAAAFRAHWADAARLVRGREIQAPGYLALQDWVGGLQLPDADRALQRGGPPDRTLTQLILALDPDSEPVFRGRVMSRRGLLDLLGDSLRDPGAAATLDAVYGEAVLDAVDGAPGCAGLALTAHRWRQLVDSVERSIPSGARQRIGADRMSAVRGRLLVVALDPAAAPAAREAAEARSDPRSMRQDWFRALAEADFGSDRASQAEALALLRSLAAEQTDRQDAEVARQQEYARQQRATAEQYQRAQQRDRVDRVSGLISFVLAIATLTLAPAPLTAPLGLYFGIRARRSPSTGCLSAIGLWVGALFTLLLVVAGIVYLAVDPDPATTTTP